MTTRRDPSAVFVSADEGAAKLAYRVHEAASAMGVSARTVWRLIASGDITARRLGGSCVIPADELRRYLASLPTVSLDKKAAQS